MPNQGHVYILINPSFRLNRYKIGMTTKSPAERAAEISGATGVPEPFEVAYSREVIDCRLAERVIHDKLVENRISSNREFYEIPLQDAVAILHAVVDKINAGWTGDGPTQATECHAQIVQPSVELAGTGTGEADIDVHIPPAKAKRAPSAGGSKKTGRRTIEEHLTVCHPDIRQLFTCFSDRVKGIDPAIEENSWSYGVAYRARQNFVELYFRSNRLEVCLRPGDYTDPQGLLGKVPDSYKWTLNRRFLLESRDQLDYLLSLVRQSWDGVQ